MSETGVILIEKLDIYAYHGFFSEEERLGQRFVLDLARMLARQWRPRGFALVLAEFTYTVTDPPIRLVRRVIPPLRVGGAALDFAWSIVMLVVIILMSVTLGFMN